MTGGQEASVERAPLSKAGQLFLSSVLEHALFGAGLLFSVPPIPSVPDQYGSTGPLGRFGPVVLIVVSGFISVKAKRSSLISAIVRTILLSIYLLLLPEVLEGMM